MASSYRLELNRWLASLEVKADCVFDIGGSQEEVKKRVKSWQVADYYIFDLEQPHADSQAPDVICDLNKHKQPRLDGYRGLADIVFCLEVLDYVYDPMNAFKIIYNLLKPGGKAYISAPFFYHTHNPIEDDCLRYTEFGLRKLAENNNLTVTDIIRRRPETNAIDSLWRLERIRAAKHYDHDVLGWIIEVKK